MFRVVFASKYYPLDSRPTPNELQRSEVNVHPDGKRFHLSPRIPFLIFLQTLSVVGVNQGVGTALYDAVDCRVEHF